MAQQIAMFVSEGTALTTGTESLSDLEPLGRRLLFQSSNDNTAAAILINDKLDIHQHYHDSLKNMGA